MIWFLGNRPIVFDVFYDSLVQHHNLQKLSFLADISKRLLGDLPISLKSFTCPRFSQSSFGLHLVLKIVRSSPAFFVVRSIVLSFLKDTQSCSNFLKIFHLSSAFPDDRSILLVFPKKSFNHRRPFSKSHSSISRFSKKLLKLLFFTEDPQFALTFPKNNQSLSLFLKRSSIVFHFS